MMNVYLSGHQLWCELTSDLVVCERENVFGVLYVKMCFVVVFL